MSLCRYCGSTNMLIHGEGSTCTDCCRISLDSFFTDVFTSENEEVELHSSKSNLILSEISIRTGISKSLENQILLHFKKARSLVKTVSCEDLILVSIYQSYLHSRTFISFSKLVYLYPTKSNATVLNNIYFKLICENIFDKSPNFTLDEVFNSTINYFRISMKDSILIREYITSFNDYLKYDPHVHIVGAAFQYLISHSRINNSITYEEVFAFLGVKKSTIANKVKSIIKLIKS